MVTKLFIAADHGGFALKEELKEKLADLRAKDEYFDKLEIVDLGAYELDPGDDYPPLAINLAEQVSSQTEFFGVLVCRSGIGMSIAANKVKGAYAALCFALAHAQVAREHNNANILVLDADYAGDSPYQMLEEFLRTDFAADRHARRVNQIKDYEQSNG